MKIKYLFFIIAVTIYFAGCGVSKQEKDALMIMSNQILSDIKMQRFDKVEELFSDEMQKDISNEGFEEFIDKMMSTYGEMKNWEFYNFTWNSQFGSSSGTYYTVEYKVNQDEAIAIHRLTFIKESGEFKLRGYQIDIQA